jgi:hypothetical protein
MAAALHGDRSGLGQRRRRPLDIGLGGHRSSLTRRSLSLVGGTPQSAP